MSVPLRNRHSGKIALVTASTKGIGYAIVERLVHEGASVIISSRGKKNVDDAVNQLKSAVGPEGENRIHGIVCHVGDAVQRKSLVEQTIKIYGKIDYLVSNAAVNPTFGLMIDTTDEKSWDKVFDINVKSHFFLIKDCLPYMASGSSIIIVSSYAGFVPNNLLGAYSISKTSLLSLVKVLGKELAPKNIRVNGLCPGIIKTKFSEMLWKNEDIGNKNKSEIPLGRFGTPEECAGTASFLLSGDAGFITGENLVVAGGVQSRL